MELLQTLKDFSPMGTLALALFIIFQLVRGKMKMNEITDNHLHEMPELLERSRTNEKNMNEVIRLLTIISNK